VFLLDVIDCALKRLQVVHQLIGGFIRESQRVRVLRARLLQLPNTRHHLEQVLLDEIVQHDDLVSLRVAIQSADLVLRFVVG
jgi:hypothetical protein